MSAQDVRDAGGLALPAGKRFVFTILDDTDDARVDNVGPVYALLEALGFRTTKTVWPVACPEGSRNYFAGDTLAEPAYRLFCEQLHRDGFELTWHSATMESSTRSRIEQGLETFTRVFGIEPRVHTNHAQNRENIYWGGKRYRTAPLRWLAALGRGAERYEGEVTGSPYFWGDLCKQAFPYVRNFTFRRVNTRSADPYFPYRLEQTPYVNLWFSTSDAADIGEFRRLMTHAAVDQLCEERGVCILSTHLGKGFATDGRVDPSFEAVLRHIAELPGWFVPAGELLDHMVRLRTPPTLTRLQLLRLETRHALDRLRGTGRGPDARAPDVSNTPTSVG